MALASDIVTRKISGGCNRSTLCEKLLYRGTNRRSRLLLPIKIIELHSKA